MSDILDSFHFGRLIQMIRNEIGLDCSHYKPGYLKRRVAVRMRATQSQDYRAYEKILASNREEYDLLLDRLTINVSHFFRDVTVFEEMKKSVLPRLAQKSSVRIWSAGCANGEEPYSLAMLFDKEFPKHKHWEILATDLDPNCLLRAKVGRYKLQSLVETPPAYKARYFHQDGEFWDVNPELKKKIKFRVLDLTSDMPRERIDMILCRNVMIYFMPLLQDRLYEGFYDILKPNGFLVLGKTETMLGEQRLKFESVNGRERIYQAKADILPAKHEGSTHG